MARGRLLLAAAVVAVAAGAAWCLFVVRDGEPAVRAEVCDTTEYEGCPQRWEYLWADQD